MQRRIQIFQKEAATVMSCTLQRLSRAHVGVATGVALLIGVTLHAQRVPQTKSEVARPGGKVPGAPRLALVKVAEGFNDPTNVASANDGSGRIFVVERVGRVKIVDKDGKILPQPFLDLTKINPLGTDVQTGFVEQGLYSIAFHPNFRQNGYFYAHYAFASITAHLLSMFPPFLAVLLAKGAPIGLMFWPQLVTI